MVDCKKWQQVQEVDVLFLTILSYMSLAEQTAVAAISKTFLAASLEILRTTKFLINPIKADIKIFFVMNDLIELSLSACKWIDSDFGGDYLLAILGNSCLQLKYLDISSISTVSDLGVAILAKGCLSLEHVDLTLCTSTSYISVLLLRGEGVESIEDQLQIYKSVVEMKPGKIFCSRRIGGIDPHSRDRSSQLTQVQRIPPW